MAKKTRENADAQPLPSSSRDVLAAFNATADAIVTEWWAREQKGMTGRMEGANAWLKREAYKLILRYIEADQLSVLARNFRKDGRSHKLVDEAVRNPFKLGLLAMFSDEALPRGKRHVFGNQMLYAWAHDVPPDFLNAFLAVSGGPAQIAEKIKARQPEPGFEHRFIRERLIDLG